MEKNFIYRSQTKALPKDTARKENWRAESFDGSSVFWYAKSQPYAFDRVPLTLDQVIGRILSGELNGDNTLTIDRWMNNIMPNVYVPYFSSGYEDRKEHHFRGFLRSKLAHQYPFDFPAWGLLRDIEGKLHVAVNQKIGSEHWIGALDINAYRSTQEIKLNEKRRVMYASSWQLKKPSDMHPTRGETRYSTAVAESEADDSSGLYAKFALFYSSDSKGGAKVWNAGKRPKLVFMGVPVVSGGGLIGNWSEYWFDNLAHSPKGVEPAGLVLGKYEKNSKNVKP